MGEWVESTRTLVKYACMDTQRRAAVISKHERPLERSGRDDDDAGRWDADVYAAIEAQRREQESDEDDADALASGRASLIGRCRSCRPSVAPSSSSTAPTSPSRRCRSAWTSRATSSTPRAAARSRISPSSASATSHEHHLEQILGEFIDAWKAGERPDVDAYLARARNAERDELATQLATWLEIAPTPRYDEATRAEIAEEPALRAALDAAAALRSPLSERLPTLRRPGGPQGARCGAAPRRRLRPRRRAARRQLPRSRSSVANSTRADCRAACSTRWPRSSAPTATSSPRARRPSPRARRSSAPTRTPTTGSPRTSTRSRAPRSHPRPSPMDELDRLFLGGPGA